MRQAFSANQPRPQGGCGRSWLAGAWATERLILMLPPFATGPSEECVEDFLCNEAFEAAEDLGFRESFSSPASRVTAREQPMNSLGQEEVQEQIRPAKAANLFVANGQGA
jgi:hypothetical protein